VLQHLRFIPVLVCIILIATELEAGVPNGTAFTYEGQLSVGGTLVGGSYDITFSLYDALLSGTQIGPTLTNSFVLGTNGAFRAVLDFGPGAFTGDARWMEVSVRTNGDGIFTMLGPRQAITPMPYAVQAASVGQVAASNVVGSLVSGQFASSVIFSNIGIRYATIANATIQSLSAGMITGNGASLSNLPLPGDLVARLAPTPPLIYSPYYDFYYGVTTNQTDAFLRQIGQQMATNGLLAAGWNFIWIDDSWPSLTRDDGGNLVADPVRFPFGMPALVTYLHGLGFKVGIYSSFGGITCLGFPGSDQGHLPKDAQLFASWGIDGLKLDACNQPMPPEDAYSYDVRMLRTAANAILDANRDMVFMAVTMTDAGPYGGRPLPWLVQSEANTFVVWGVSETIASVSNAVLNAAYTAQYCSNLISPGHYPWQGAFDLSGMDLNSLQAGISMAAMVSAPLTVSSYWPGSVLNLLTNAEALAIQEDPAAICGTVAWSNNLAEIWTKPLGGRATGANALALVNLAPTNQSVMVNWSMLGAAADDPITIRDLWAHNTLGTYTNSWSNVVPANSVQLFRATGLTGVTTNLTVLRPGGSTNVLVFKNGILVDLR
jgi:alpha-galactosidase